MSGCRQVLRVQPLPHTRSCFVCGEANPLGLRLRLESDGRLVQATFTPLAEHVGFKGVVHGGLIATVLDEIMVWACAVSTRRFAFCAEMKVRFLNPMPPGATVRLTGELVADHKGRLFEAKGTAQNSNGLVLAEATGKYLPIKGRDLSEMAADFVGDPGWLHEALAPHCASTR